MMDSKQKSALLAWIALAVGVAALLYIISVALPAEAGDYWILRDQRGGILLTNQKPQPGYTVIRHYELEDVSAEEVRAAEARDWDFWIGLKIEERTQAIDRLTAEMAKDRDRDRDRPTINIGLGVGGTSVDIRPTIVVPRKK